MKSNVSKAISPEFSEFRSLSSARGDAEPSMSLRSIQTRFIRSQQEIIKVDNDLVRAERPTCDQNAINSYFWEMTVATFIEFVAKSRRCVSHTFYRCADPRR